MGLEGLRTHQAILAEVYVLKLPCYWLLGTPCLVLDGDNTGICNPVRNTGGTSPGVYSSQPD